MSIKFSDFTLSVYPRHVVKRRALFQIFGIYYKQKVTEERKVLVVEIKHVNICIGNFLHIRL